MSAKKFHLSAALASLRPFSIALVAAALLCPASRPAAAEESGDYFAAALAAEGPIAFVDTEANLRDIAWSPDGEWISFGSIESGNEDIWIRRAAGGERIRVTFDEATDLYASWAPDGKSLLWASDRGDRTNLWTRNPFADEAPRQVTADADSLAAVGFAISSFSPDGTQIAFTSSKGGNNDIWVRDLRSGAIEQLTRNPHRDFIPHSWSPDGRQIAFTSDRATPGLGGGDIWIVEVYTGAERQLTSAEGWEWCPVWSPDGRFILYSHASPGTGGVQLYASAADGSRTQKVLGMPFFGAFVPSWVPGKPLLAFNGGHRRDGLFTLAAGAQTRAELPIGDEIVGMEPSPSGALLAVAAFEDSAVLLKEYRLGREPLQGRVVRRFAVQEWLGAQMRWHPDEQSLLLQLVKADQSHVLYRIGMQDGEVQELVAAGEISLNRRPWAPSGKRLAYVATHGEGDKDLFTLSLRNLKKRQITFGGVVQRGYDWSPDGRQLVYGGQEAGQAKADLYSVPASRGKAVRLLAWEKSSELSPQFSPGGKFISFVSDRSGTDDLWLLERATGAVRAVEGGNVGVFNRTLWDGDGAGITWSRGQGQVFRYDLATDKTTLIYRGKSWGTPVGWSPGGSLLLRANKEGGDLWLMRAPKLEPEI